MADGAGVVVAALLVSQGRRRWLSRSMYGSARDSPVAAGTPVGCTTLLLGRMGVSMGIVSSCVCADLASGIA